MLGITRPKLSWHYRWDKLGINSRQRQWRFVGIGWVMCGLIDTKASCQSVNRFGWSWLSRTISRFRCFVNNLVSMTMKLVVSLLVMTQCKKIMPNDKQPIPSHVVVLTNQMLVYKHHRVIPRTVIPRIESTDKTPKLNPRINLGISSDLEITNPRLNDHS